AAGDKPLESGLGEHHVVVVQDVVGVQLARVEQVHVLQVPQAQPGGLLLVAVEHHQNLLGLGPVAQRRLGLLGARLLPADHVRDDVQLARTDPVGESAAQGLALHLLRGPLRVVARLRTMHRATTDELRGADRALAGVAGALLAVRLLATTRHHSAGLGGVRTLPGCRQLRHDDLVQQRNAGLHVEDLGGQLDGAVGLAARGTDVERQAHHAPPFAGLFTRTSPPLGPGRAPLISNRPDSASILCTLRFCVVTRLEPIRPAIRMPLKTRPGVAQPPIEPGLRCTAWAPWLDGCRWKPCRLMVPAKPLPLLVPTTSTKAPASKVSAAVISWPTSYSLASAVRSSTTWRRGVTPALAKWPARGLFTLRGSVAPYASCTAE